MPERGSDQRKLLQPEQLLKKIKKLGTKSPTVRPKNKKAFPMMEKPFFVSLYEFKIRSSHLHPILDEFGNHEKHCHHKWFEKTDLLTKTC